MAFPPEATQADDLAASDHAGTHDRRGMSVDAMLTPSMGSRCFYPSLPVLMPLRVGAYSSIPLSSFPITTQVGRRLQRRQRPLELLAERGRRALPPLPAPRAVGQGLAALPGRRNWRPWRAGAGRPRRRRARPGRHARVAARAQGRSPRAASRRLLLVVIGSRGRASSSRRSRSRHLRRRRRHRHRRRRRRRRHVVVVVATDETDVAVAASDAAAARRMDGARGAAERRDHISDPGRELADAALRGDGDALARPRHPAEWVAVPLFVGGGEHVPAVAARRDLAAGGCAPPRLSSLISSLLFSHSCSHLLPSPLLYPRLSPLSSHHSSPLTYAPIASRCRTPS